MITARQIRAARALLGWSQQNLADKAVVSLNAVTRPERGEVDPRFSSDGCPKGYHQGWHRVHFRR